MTSPIPRSFYLLHLELQDVNPPVWRKVEVPGDLDLDHLDIILGSLVSWEGLDPSYFLGRDGFSTDLDSFSGPGAHDAGNSLVERIFPMVGTEMEWICPDENADWVYSLRLESIRTGAENETERGLVGGERDSPPEEMGGPAVYQRMIDAHHRGDPVPEWDRDYHGRAFDPAVWNDETPRQEVSSVLFRHHHREKLQEIHRLESWPGRFPGDLIEKVESDPERYRDVIRYLARMGLENCKSLDGMDLLGSFGMSEVYDLVPFYILARWRDPDLFPMLMELSRLEEDSLMEVCGTTMLEDVPRMLAITCGNRIDEVDALVCDQKATLIARRAGILTFEYLFLLGEIELKQWTRRLRRWMTADLERKRHKIWDAVAVAAARTHPKALMAPLRRGLAEEWISEYVLDWHEVEADARAHPDGIQPETISREDLTVSTVEALGDLAVWDEPDEFFDLLGENEIGDENPGLFFM